MSKVSKILISLSFAFIVAFSFMFANLQPLFAKADSISNYNVSFIAPDNSLLYSTGNYVPSGSSLQDLENNNLLLNSDFLSNSNGQDSYTNTTSSNKMTVDNWQIVLGANGVNFCTVSTLNQGVNVAFTIPDGSSYASGGTPFVQILSSDLVNSLIGQTVTFSLYCKINSGSARFRVSNYSTFGTGNLVDGLNTVTYTVPSGSTQMFCGIITNTNTSFDIDVYYAKLEIGSTFTGYFSSNMINSRLSAYNFSNYYYLYNIDTLSAITSDIYYYPTSYRFDSDWFPKIWGSYSNLDGSNIWTDGNFYYYSRGYSQYVLDVSSNSWVPKTWYGLTNFDGNNIWTDGNFYYYSYGPEQYVLDVSTSTWSSKTWAFSGDYVIESDFKGSNIWFDGNYYYLSTGNQQFRLDVSTSIWSKLVWSGYNNFDGNNIWTDGSNYYYSYFDTQYLIDVSSYSVFLKTWSGISYFEGVYVWTDGSSIYYSDGYSQLLLDVSTSSWVPKTWTGIDSNFVGNRIWTDGSNYYYSSYSYQYVLGNSALIDDNYFYNNGYNNGYTSGYNNGYTSGYNKGYNKGVEEAGNYTFFSLISAVMDAPLKVFYGLFNFELMGVNLAGFIQALLSLAILLFIIRFALQK